MNSHSSLLATTPQQAGMALRERLGKKSGVELKNAYRGHLGKGKADVAFELEPPDGILVSMQTAAKRPIDALYANAHLPGTLRFARNHHGWALIADTRLNGEAHLPETMKELRAGIDRVRSGKPKRRRKVSNRSKSDWGSLEQALEAISPEDSPFVKLDGQWESYCRLGNRLVSLRVSPAGSGIRIHRSVVSGLEAAASNTEAVADVALRANYQIRHARLALDGDELQVEARLSRHVIDAAWLSFHIRAVAAACLHVAAPLRILASQPEIAQRWSAVSVLERELEESAVFSC